MFPNVLVGGPLVVPGPGYSAGLVEVSEHEFKHIQLRQEKLEELLNKNIKAEL